MSKNTICIWYDRKQKRPPISMRQPFPTAMSARSIAPQAIPPVEKRAM